MANYICTSKSWVIYVSEVQCQTSAERNKCQTVKLSVKAFSVVSRNLHSVFVSENEKSQALDLNAPTLFVLGGVGSLSCCSQELDCMIIDSLIKLDDLPITVDLLFDDFWIMFE